MNLFETLGKALRPDTTPEQKKANAKHDLEHMNADSFFGSTTDSWEFEIQADGENCTYLLTVAKDFLNSEYYDIDTPNYISDDEDWKHDREWLRTFMIENINQVEILN